jgi:hypothetical protein
LSKKIRPKLIHKIDSRRRSGSDTGFTEAASASGPPGPPNNGSDSKPEPPPKLPPKLLAKSEGSSRIGGGLFRIFNKSATLLFKHPTTELNPNKPYKGTVTTSREKQSVTKRLPSVGEARRTSEEYRHYRQHRQWPSLTRLDKALPQLAPVAASSSMSSLNSSSVHHHVAYSSSDDSGRPSGSGISGNCAREASTKKGSSSSSTSVISTSSSEEEGSNYDSGAFSRCLHRLI